MSSAVTQLYRWTPASRGQSGSLSEIAEGEITGSSIRVADSWFVTEGSMLALGMHRDRFLAGLQVDSTESGEEFWDAAITTIPRTGDWFPRVEQRDDDSLVLRLRPAPDRSRSARVVTMTGADPRSQPLVKGPDLESLSRLRAEAGAIGADEVVILSPDGFVVEGSSTALVWWRGAILCAPPAEFARVNSVTARSLLGLANALGVDLHTEAVTPSELDGTEIWALNALHGLRIITDWADGPSVAELPGRLSLWRNRLEALRHPLVSSGSSS